MPQEDILTAHLINIIQALQLSRETGTLIAKRGDGAFSEEGRIVFTNGRITETRVGSHRGSDAFNRISAWENCLVSFRSPDSSNSLLFASKDTPAPMSTSPYTTSSLLRGVHPVPEDNNRQENYSTSGPLPRLEMPMGQERAPGIPFLVQPLPYVLSLIEQNKLSRIHRQLVLLIDGKRSAEELARLIGREISDIYRVLHDLTSIRAIQITNELFQ